MADPLYCKGLTTEGDGCVCITRETAEKLVTEQRVKKIEQQAVMPEMSIGTTMVIAVGFLLGVLFCQWRKI